MHEPDSGATSRSPARRACCRSPRSPAGLGIPADALYAVRQRQGQGALRVSRAARRPAGRQARAGHRDHADAGRRGQDHDHGRPRRRAQPDRPARHDLPARALARPVLRHEGRRGRRRLRPGRADGGHQPPLHRRLPRHRRRPQPARRADRQPPLLGQRARPRRAPDHLAPRDGHERPRAAPDRELARRQSPTASRARTASTSRSPPRSWRSSASPRTSTTSSSASARSSSATPASAGR